MVFRQIADRRAGRGFPRIAAENNGPARSRMRRREQHLDEGGLTRAVRSQQAIGRAAGNAERNIINGRQSRRGQRVVKTLVRFSVSMA